MKFHRRLFACAFLLTAVGVAPADDNKNADGLIRGSIDDAALQKEAPANAVILNARDLDKLCKAWSIKPPMVDFEKQLVIVGTWKGSSFNASVKLVEGDLRISFLGTKDLRPGFRFLLQPYPREGVKTINGR